MPENDPLDALRDQIRSATEAAERLVREAGVPPAGWAGADDVRHETTAELRALADLVQALRDLLPPELQEQLTEVIKQLLILIRAVIDWLVARIEREPLKSTFEVQDIPIA